VLIFMLISCVLRQVQAQERVKEWWEPEEEEEEEEEVDEVEYDDGWGVKARMEALALLARIVSPSYCGSPHLEFPKIKMIQSLSFCVYVYVCPCPRICVSVSVFLVGFVPSQFCQCRYLFTCTQPSPLHISRTMLCSLPHDER